MMVRDPFARFSDAVVLDGGLATELEARGADLSDELWSARVLIDDPASIVEVHRAYVDAGADVVIGASYQASYEGLAHRGVDHDVATQLLARSVDLAREGADGRALVAASVGPYGAVLANGAEYTGDYGLGDTSDPRAFLRDFHGPRAEALVAAEPDLLAIETIPSIVEAEALMQVLDDLPDVAAWVSFSCRDASDLNDGTPFDAAVDLVADHPVVVAVGVNCTTPLAVPGLVERAAERTTKPVVAYPNRGGTWDPARKRWTGDDAPDGFGPLALELRAAGARLIGGCCGTGPSDIRAVATALRPAA
jgi:homocysteine S-methyltransferase